MHTSEQLGSDCIAKKDMQHRHYYHNKNRKRQMRVGVWDAAAQKFLCLHFMQPGIWEMYPVPHFEDDDGGPVFEPIQDITETLQIDRWPIIGFIETYDDLQKKNQALEDCLKKLIAISQNRYGAVRWEQYALSPEMEAIQELFEKLAPSDKNKRLYDDIYAKAREYSGIQEAPPKDNTPNGDDPA